MFRKPKLIQCPDCHGTGQADVFNLDTGTYDSDWCILCIGMGKVDRETIETFRAELECDL